MYMKPEYTDDNGTQESNYKSGLQDILYKDVKSVSCSWKDKTFTPCVKPVGFGHVESAASPRDSTAEITVLKLSLSH